VVRLNEKACRSSHKAAIHKKVLPADPAGLPAHQKGHGVGDVLRRADAPQGRVPGETVDLSRSNPREYEALLQLWRTQRRQLGIVLPEDL
jgi:hypothetical protein